jgi:CheY-like chemotaxis protein
MAKTYMIDDGKNALLVSKLGFPNIDYSEKIQDIEFHNYVISIFENYDVEKLIIPVSLGNGGGTFRGLKLGLHIRLTREIGLKRLIPILFISNFDFDEIMMRAKNDYLNLNYLLLTEGVKLVENNEKMIKRVVETMTPIDANKFASDVLGRLKIIPTEIIGKHSLANQWGAFRLDEILQTNALNSKKELKNRQAELYFKFIRSLSDDFGMISSTTPTVVPNTITNIGKRILLIDDEADKGWSDVLVKIFDKSDFQFIHKNTFTQFYNDAEIRILNEDWDLILLDLRLNPEEEEKHAFIAEGNINNYSGAKLLQKIKEKNRGTQVIIFTASNKAWNMKALLDIGADGYFIKESPESGFSYQFSKENAENFMLNVETCLNKGYLHDIYLRKCAIELYLNSKIGTIDNAYDDFLMEQQTQINISYDLLYSSRIDINFVYAYLSLYKFLESIANTKVQDSMITSGLNFRWNVSTGLEPNTGSKGVYQKITFIHKHLLMLNDTSFLEALHWCKERRNNVIHPLKPSLNPLPLEQSEFNKIHSEKGYQELLTIIESILPSL